MTKIKRQVLNKIIYNSKYYSLYTGNTPVKYTYMVPEIGRRLENQPL